jgi:hypothetical protein
MRPSMEPLKLYRCSILLIFEKLMYWSRPPAAVGRPRAIKVAPLASGTRIARVLLVIGCAPPTSRADPMPKIRVSMPELQRRALLEVRRQPGCHNVQEIAINRVATHAENNWSLCVLAAGSADANTAARAAVHVQTVLRRDYDLLTD